MPKTNKFTIIIIALAITIMCALFASILFKPKPNELMRFAIYPSGISAPSYYFVLYDNEVLKCFLGTDSLNDDIKADNFLCAIYKRRSQKLQQDEFADLIKLADELNASNYIDLDWSCSGWYYVGLYYNGRVYRETYQFNQTEALVKLQNEIIRLSPLKIEITDLSEMGYYEDLLNYYAEIRINLNQPILRADPPSQSAAPTAPPQGEPYDESRVERYTYFLDGKLQSSRDKNGIVTSYGYDIHGRKISEDAGGVITNYQYDNAGNLLTVSDASGSIVRTYDALNRTVSKTVPGFWHHHLI